jgi:hypothetical protein
MTALVRYQLADLVGSQRWVAPLLAYVGFLGLLYAADAGPAAPAYGVSVLALFPVSAWLTRQTLSVEDDAGRQVTAAAAGGLVRVQVALLTSAVVVELPLVALSVAWAEVANHGNMRGSSAVLGGLAVHLVFALAGVGLGAVVARPVLRPPGAAALLIVGVFVLSMVVHWSPVFLAVRTLQSDPVHHFRAQLLPGLAALVGIGAGLSGATVLAAARE